MKEISKKQLEANQKNAKLGGVKTEEGKNTSKYNAVKHGIFRQTISEYEYDFNKSTLSALYSEFKPTSFLQEYLVDLIGTYMLRLFRTAKAEQEFMKYILDPHIEKVREFLEESILTITNVEREGYKPQASPTNIQDLIQVYQRYSTTLENRLYRTIDELKKLQGKEF